MTSIAVFGLNGALGQSVLSALQEQPFASKIKSITAITRKDTPSTDKITYIQSDLSDPEALAEKLKGTDVIIELLNANPALFAATEKIANIVKPKLFIPSQFGVDIAAVSKYAPGFLQAKTDHSNNLRKAGIKTVDVVTSLFAIPGSFSYEIVGHVGVEKDNTYVVRGDINQLVSISTAPDIGRSVASLATSADFQKIPDLIRIYSENVTVKKILDTYAKNHGVELKQAGHVSQEEAKSLFQKELASGFDFSKFFFYLHSIVSQGDGHGTLFGENDREFVNPGESLWKWGKF